MQVLTVAVDSQGAQSARLGSRQGAGRGACCRAPKCSHPVRCGARSLPWFASVEPQKLYCNHLAEDPIEAFDKLCRGSQQVFAGEGLRFGREHIKVQNPAWFFDRFEGVGVVRRIRGQSPPTTLNAGIGRGQELHLG